MLFFLSKSLILRKDFLKNKQTKTPKIKIPSFFEKFHERSSLYMATPSNCQKSSPFRQKMYHSLYPSLRLSEPSSSTHESTCKSKVYAFMFTDVRVKTIP